MENLDLQILEAYEKAYNDYEDEWGNCLLYNAKTGYFEQKEGEFVYTPEEEGGQSHCFRNSEGVVCVNTDFYYEDRTDWIKQTLKEQFPDVPDVYDRALEMRN